MTATTYDDLLVALATWVLLGCAAWGLTVCVAAVVECLSRGRLPATTWVGCPPALRRTLLAGLGVALVAVPTQATAAGRQPPSPHPTPSGLGVAVPARAVGGPVLVPSPAGPVTEAVVVRPGDCLWHLARARLPDGAPDAAVAVLVRRIHAANRARIGPDPDLIRPGQRLIVPHETEHHHHEERP